MSADQYLVQLKEVMLRQLEALVDENTERYLDLEPERQHLLDRVDGAENHEMVAEVLSLAHAVEAHLTQLLANTKPAPKTISALSGYLEDHPHASNFDAWG